VLVVLLALIALGTVTLLGIRADTSQTAQLNVGRLTLVLSDLQSAPFNADPHAGGDPSAVLAEVRSDVATLDRGLSRSDALDVPPRQLAAGRRDLRVISTTAARIYAIAIGSTGLEASTEVPALQKTLTVRSAELDQLLARAGRADAGRSHNARVAARLGTALVILALLSAFLIFFLRATRARRAAERLAGENERLWAISRLEASTDALTGLGNRRALGRDLRHELVPDAPGVPGVTGAERPLLLAIFDLNGFKQYNDSFGHGAGDGLLARLGARLRQAIGGEGTAYRMGGDEFCVLAGCSPERAAELIEAAVEALSESGDGWSIDCCVGTVWVPAEADTATAALRIADQRMYAGKATRSSASRELTGVLLQVLAEQSPVLGEHSDRVARLAAAVAGELGLDPIGRDAIAHAGRLHDVGKTAVPAEILHKPGPLTASEWEFLRRAPLVAERILMASPTLAASASLVRSAHERVDGGGYPDGLHGEQIPLGSRIIAVCDAFDAITSPRPYRAPRSEQQALAELQRCAATQFDPEAVAALRRVLSAQERSLSRSAIWAAP
jgi:diguanylate cyclase (GGDEF)-like protein